MTELLHRLKIFVYRLHERRPDYLLLRGPGPESFWSPVHGPIGFGEKIDTAIRRELVDDVGLTRAGDLLDLEMPARWLVGDEEIIEWTFGFRTPSHAADLTLAERWADFRWAGFSQAYPSLELDEDRAAIMRLHALLHDAA